MMRLIGTACAALVLFIAGPAMATEKLLQLIKPDGTKIDVSIKDLEAIGPVELKTRLFGEGPTDRKVRGPLMRDVLSYFGISGTVSHFVALDAYRIDIPVDDYQKYDVVLAFEIDGQRMSIREKGPTRIIYPITDRPELEETIYESRSVWSIEEIRFK